MQEEDKQLVEVLLNEKTFYEELKELMAKYKYEDILKDRLPTEVKQEFNDIHRDLVMLYHCDFALPSTGSLAILNF